MPWSRVRGVGATMETGTGRMCQDGEPRSDRSKAERGCDGGGDEGRQWRRYDKCGGDSKTGLGHDVGHSWSGGEDDPAECTCLMIQRRGATTNRQGMGIAALLIVTVPDVILCGRSYDKNMVKWSPYPLVNYFETEGCWEPPQSAEHVVNIFSYLKRMLQTYSNIYLIKYSTLKKKITYGLMGPRISLSLSHPVLSPYLKSCPTKTLALPLHLSPSLAKFII